MAAIDPLSVIYNEAQWRLSNVSPMCNLECSIVKLKQYSAKIRQCLASSVSNTSTKFKVGFEEEPHLKYTENDASALMITVQSSNSENSNKTKLSYMGILLSWGKFAKIKGATHLPYLLERGELRAGMAVHTALQSMFDCNIRPYNFTQHQMLHLSFACLECDTSRNTDQFVLNYTIPREESKNKLTFGFDIGDVHIVWRGIKDELGGKPQLVNAAYQMLQNQIYYSIQCNVNSLDLQSICLPKAEIKVSGVVKMKTPESVNAVFETLNNITSFYDFVK